ncbi:MAG: hypothetical protein JSS02_29875 [Planctomycetes bacterium]|nr:hypothetical protein [Planctomycetota bacterium]
MAEGTLQPESATLPCCPSLSYDHGRPGPATQLASLDRTHAPVAECEARIQIDELDNGRLIVNRPFRGILSAQGLTTFEALYTFAGGDEVRRVKSRRTVRIELPAPTAHDATAVRVFYLKRHEPPRWSEQWRPLLNFGKPILGGRNEWQAILKFQAAGIPTMTPVAFGESQGRSLVLTEDLGTDYTLLDWAQSVANNSSRHADFAPTADEAQKRTVIHRVAALARRMHAVGAHHQDFYLNHILWCGDPADFDFRVIDLGRVGFSPRLSQRWIRKDLAQLDYSARTLSCADRLRFLRLYLGRPFTRSDRELVRKIARKSRHIASHSAKHQL